MELISNRYGKQPSRGLMHSLKLSWQRRWKTQPSLHTVLLSSMRRLENPYLQEKKAQLFYGSVAKWLPRSTLTRFVQRVTKGTAHNSEMHYSKQLLIAMTGLSLPSTNMKMLLISSQHLIRKSTF